MIDATLPGNSNQVAAAKLLTAIVVPGRYPGDTDEPSVLEAQALARAAGVLRGYARTKLGLPEEI